MHILELPVATANQHVHISGRLDTAKVFRSDRDDNLCAPQILCGPSSYQAITWLNDGFEAISSTCFPLVLLVHWLELNLVWCMCEGVSRVMWV